MKIETAILECLSRRAPTLAGEVQLRNQVEYELGNQVSLAELKTRLRNLEVGGDVVCIPNQDLGNRWALTDQGTARIYMARQG